MIRKATAVLDKLFGIPLRFSGRIDIGPDTRVIWRRLHVGPGNHLALGESTTFGGSVLFEATGGEIHIGDRCYVGASSLICHSKIHIGSDVIISWGCTIVDHNSHSVGWPGRQNDVQEWAQGRKDWSRVKRAPIVIEDRVWLGFGVTILKGVRIGVGSVIGAASVVTRDVPPYSVAAGNPARVVRELLPDER